MYIHKVYLVISGQNDQTSFEDTQNKTVNMEINTENLSNF